jgi:hypothetical protein
MSFRGNVEGVGIDELGTGLGLGVVGAFVGTFVGNSVGFPVAVLVGARVGFEVGGPTGANVSPIPARRKISGFLCWSPHFTAEELKNERTSKHSVSNGYWRKHVCGSRGCQEKRANVNTVISVTSS